MNTMRIGRIIQRGAAKAVRASALASFLLFSAITAFAEHWTFLYRTDGIEVSSNDASPPTFKAEGILAADVVDILTVFADVPRRIQWVRYLDESRIILDNHVDRVLVYNRYHLPWPASDRDSLIETKYLIDYEGGEATIRFNSVEHPGEPPKSNVIRIPRANGVLRLKVLGAGKTYVRYEVNLDPGGWLPQWTCNFCIRDAPITMLQAMKRRITDVEILNREFRDAQMRLWHGEPRKTR